jgi:hypothetical protein
MARNNNKINLPTNTTDIRTLAKYLLYINNEGKVLKENEQQVFANVKINESRKNVTNPAKDTHTKSTLKLFGLIDVFEDDSFSVSELGIEVINYFNDENSFSEEDRVALMLKVLCRWEIKDNYGRHIHPGYILIKLLCDPEMNYYITNHELSHFVMCEDFLLDNQYEDIKKFILEFRNLELPYDKNWKTSKSDIFLSTFDSNWGLLTRTLSKKTLTDSQYNKLQKQWEADPTQYVTESEDSNDGVNADRNTINVNECRLHALSAYISKIYISLIDGVSVRDYSTRFNSTISPKVEVETIQKIYFGAPGTGKSYQITQDLKDVDLIFQKRVTFHPEYDNASFVGGYKPITDINGDIKYEFVPQIFTNIYVEACNDPSHQYYLIIEEINRGNCAEIFGELFQLLDRNKDYKITPSNELINYLNTNISNSIFYIEGKMLLPDNLSILATMNTSDQSLFPMDSAFKRRWEWEYIPINYSTDSSVNKSALYKIKIGDDLIDWITFISAINKRIQSNKNLGMDKCIGNYFIEPDSSNNITLDKFIYKVLFYLWNDVFKDEPKDSIFGDKSYQDFFPIETKGEQLVIKILEDIKITIPKLPVSETKPED